VLNDWFLNYKGCNNSNQISGGVNQTSQNQQSEMVSHKSIPFSGFLITFVGAILFSTKAIIVKKAFAHTHIDPLTLLTLRMLFSLPFYIAAAFLVHAKKGDTGLTKRQWLYVIILGIFGYYLSSFFDFVGLQYISAGLERLILFLYPSFALLINHFFFKEKMSRNQVLALLLTYAGIAIAYFGELHIDSSNAHFFVGSLLINLCAITYSLYIAGSGRIIPAIGAAKFTAWAMLAATGGIFIHFLLRGHYQPLQSGIGLWVYGILLAIIATVIPSFLISGGLKRIGSNNVAIISGVGPVSTIIQAHFFLGEPIFFAQIAGTVLVVAGVLLIGWRSSSP
jgi:drug/metabolite transporter (DMT)-like permease